METSHNKAWKCGNLHMYFFWFRLTEDMRDILPIREYFTHYLASIELNFGCHHHSHKFAFMEKLGNLEVEIERMGGKMDHEQKKNPIWNKKISEDINERLEWPIPYPTWMIISLSWSCLTSRVSVHSLCKGQAIALQMPKENSQMIKNTFIFLITYFYNPHKVLQVLIHSHRIPSPHSWCLVTSMPLGLQPFIFHQIQMVST